MVSTILDSSKIDTLGNLHLNLKCSANQKCLISAAIFVINLEDLCYSIETLRDIVSEGNIVISIVIRRVFKLGFSDWSQTLFLKIPKNRIFEKLSIRTGLKNEILNFFPRNFRKIDKWFMRNLRMGSLPEKLKTFSNELQAITIVIFCVGKNFLIAELVLKFKYYTW